MGDDNSLESPELDEGSELDGSPEPEKPGDCCRRSRKDEDPLVRETVHLLLDAARGHKNLMNRSLEKTGVFQSQHRILMYLSDHTYESQKKIAEDMHISTAAAAVSIKKLEAGGYLTKEMDPNDNRINTIRITEKGLDVVEESLRIFPRVDQETLEGVSPEEMQVMHDVLEKVVENLRKLNS
ncbi:MAG: MarR family winged helix-turn-helix transcriptional regulator [Lachnospiraceae bacterium]|nr:MarR family winged helix-turn-helix transcriptional regulator [Lachnospiraceae bacterium]